MRYIRFLKTPRVVCDTKTSSRPHVQCLITITSDLGDSFLPCNVQLSAELLACDSRHHESVLVWNSVQWTAGMRTLPISLPLPKSGASSRLRLKVGTTPKSSSDDFQGPVTQHSASIVSVWSAPFTRLIEAPRLAERRFQMTASTLRIWEETGNSIARHLWDAGVLLSCHLEQLLFEESKLAQALFPDRLLPRHRVLELGTGCGIVGIALAQSLENFAVIVTDLAEARELVESNLGHATAAAGSSVHFQELDWDEELPQNLASADIAFDLILAADCTYNADSSPAFVDTIHRLVRQRPSTVVAIAMKMRHASETVFFELMAAAAFTKVSTLTFPLPAGSEDTEDTVDLHLFRYASPT